MRKRLLTSTALITAGMVAAGGAAHAQKKAKKPFFTVNIYGKSSAGVGLERGVARLDCAFNILRVMVPTPDDDQVFDAAGDKQLTAMEEP